MPKNKEEKKQRDKYLSDNQKATHWWHQQRVSTTLYTMRAIHSESKRSNRRIKHHSLNASRLSPSSAASTVAPSCVQRTTCNAKTALPSTTRPWPGLPPRTGPSPSASARMESCPCVSPQTRHLCVREERRLSWTTCQPSSRAANRD